MTFAFKKTVCTTSLAVTFLVVGSSLGTSGCTGSLATAKPTGSSSSPSTPSSPSSPAQGSGDSGSQVASIAITPNAPSVTTRDTLQLAATVTGTTTDKSVTWKVVSGHISSTGLYTAPATAGTDTITATSEADASKTASTKITITTGQIASNQGVPAFPEAQGGGAAAVGGRGGTVFEVTNLNDSGSGSLRACLQASGARTCVFRVSGLITFLSRVQVSSPYVTVAGQTAPGGGIVIGGANQRGEQLFISTHDVVIRYLTYDGNNPNTATGPDTGTVCCEMASGDIYNVVWDHITARWMGNKAFPLVSNVAGKGIHNMNIQWSLLYEPNVTHAVGIGTVYVSEGSGMATTDDDAHHNMVVSVDHRLPLNQSGRNVRWVNNIVYNW